jgi:hypothetical protein
MRSLRGAFGFAGAGFDLVLASTPIFGQSEETTQLAQSGFRASQTRRP